MADDKDNTILVHVGDSSDENRQGGAGVDVMDLGGGDDTANTGGGLMNVNLGGSGADNLTGQGVLDFLLGGSGNDTITVTGYFAIVRGGSGDDTIYGANRSDSQESLFGDEGADTIYGRAGTDFIYGGDNADTIYGGAGDDHIVGGAGDDELTGGTGADTFYFWEGHDTDTIKDFNAADGDKINLIVFDKTITWDQVSAKITTVTDENSVVTGVQIDLSDWGGGTVIVDGITSVSDLTEDMFVLNQLVGTDDVDDDLVGGDSDDTMTGGTGADTFYFGEDSGDDTITDFSTTEGDKIDLTAFSASITWEQLQAAMTAVEDDTSTTDVDESGTKIDLSAYGGGTITLRGVTSTDLTADMFVLDVLHGEDDSDDEIVGGTSDDTMSGGTGADTFFFYAGHGADKITDFSTTEGDVIDLTSLGGTITWAELQAAMTAVEDDTTTTDVVETATVIDLSAWGGGSITLEGVTSTDLTEDMFNLPDGSTTSFVVGDSDDNVFAGSQDVDLIFGAEGDDTISGGAGHDELYGGEGADTLTGGEGDDLLLGGEGDDTLSGGAGEDMLIGGEGADTLTGGDDADTFVFGEDSGNDTITDFDTSKDKIHLTAFSATVAWADLSTKITTVTDENNEVTGLQIDLSAYGGGTITLDGITSVSDLTADHFVLDQIVGSDDSDDTLQGGTSDDTMTGGTGADTFVFASNHGSDTITDFTDGDDTIDLSAFSGITGFTDLDGKISQSGSDTVIDLTDFGGGTITLEGFTSTDLSADDFAF